MPDWWNLSAVELVTLLLALYGTVVSTTLAFREMRKDRRGIRVICRLGPLVGPSGPISDVVSIQAVNIGHRPVTISGAGFLFSNDLQMTPFGDVTGRYPFPKRLTDGETVSLHIAASDVKDALRAQRERDPDVAYKTIFVRDAEGKSYKIKAPKILNEWD